MESLRQAVLEVAQAIHRDGLVVGTAGNVSVRAEGEGEGLCWITPSSVPYDEMTTTDIVLVDEEGDLVDDDAGRAPSFESVIHTAVYQARPDVGAVVHTHSRHASALAVLRQAIPAVIDEMVPYFGGPIEVAEYGQSGSDELSANVVAALADRGGVLLASHGALVAGKNAARALRLARMLEHIASIYTLTLSLGQPQPLPEDVIEMERGLYDVIRTMG